MKKLVIFLAVFIGSVAFAKCTPNNTIDEKKFEALDLLHKAQESFDDDNYKESYDYLRESRQKYDTNDRTTVLNIELSCTKLVQGPYAPKKVRYTKTKQYDFDRYTLGVQTKHHLTPKPLVVVQYIADSQRLEPVINDYKDFHVEVTVQNVRKTKRETINGQLPLEDFKVILNGEELAMPDLINTNQQVTKTFAQTKSYRDIVLSTQEKYGYQTFTKDNK